MKPDIIFPVNTPISQPFGVNKEFYSNPIYGGVKGHPGVDFFAQHGTPIYATHDGRAEYQIDAGGGHGVVITSEDRTFKTIYWHMVDSSKDTQYKSPVEGKNYLDVECGDLVGYADNTGASTGNHLHYSLKFCKDGMTLNIDNGYLGNINPVPFFNGTTPQVFNLLRQKLSLLQQLINLLLGK